MIITFVIAVEFYLIYIDWYAYYNNNKKLILKGWFKLCKNTYLNNLWPSRLYKTVMCNLNNSCNKIAPAKFEQFNLTIKDWCVLYTCYLLLVAIIHPWFTPVDWCNQPVTVLPRSATHDNSTSVNTYCIVLENHHRVAELSSKSDAEPALV